MKNPIVKYGVIGGIIFLVIGLSSWLVFKDYHTYRTAEIVGYTSMVIALLSVFFAVRKYRDDMAGGIISFSKALKVGLLTTLIPSSFAFVQTVIIFLFFGTEFQEWAMKSLKETDPAMYEQYLEQMDTAPALMTNPFFQGFVMFATVFFIGLIISVIAAMILRKGAVQ